MGFLGKIAGSAVGAGIGSVWGKHKEGADIGNKVGEYLPFKKGGRVKKGKSKKMPKMVYAYRGSVIKQAP